VKECVAQLEWQVSTDQQEWTMLVAIRATSTSTLHVTIF
jgi:hypothetical protein